MEKQSLSTSKNNGTTEYSDLYEFKNLLNKKFPYLMLQIIFDKIIILTNHNGKSVWLQIKHHKQRGGIYWNNIPDPDDKELTIVQFVENYIKLQNL